MENIEEQLDTIDNYVNKLDKESNIIDDYINNIKENLNIANKNVYSRLCNYEKKTIVYLNNIQNILNIFILSNNIFRYCSTYLNNAFDAMYFAIQIDIGIQNNIYSINKEYTNSLIKRHIHIAELNLNNMNNLILILQQYCQNISNLINTIDFYKLSEYLNYTDNFDNIYRFIHTYNNINIHKYNLILSSQNIINKDINNFISYSKVNNYIIL